MNKESTNISNTEQKCRILSVFLDSDGKLSFGRVTGTILSIYYIVLGITAFIETKQIIDIPPNLAMLIAALYGANKLSQAIKRL